LGTKYLYKLGNKKCFDITLARFMHLLSNTILRLYRIPGLQSIICQYIVQ